LKREGWPVIELKEQYRMHQCIADFPNRMVYNGQLRDGPITMRTLDAAKPGLRAVLTDIITEHGIRDDNERAQYRLEGSDAKARLHWIEVTGMRVKEMGSAAIQEHSDVVIDQIVPKLIEYFKSRGEKVADEVMILCAYSHAVIIVHRATQIYADVSR
jgi:superfamily I DNA and/or RNA helicase